MNLLIVALLALPVVAAAQPGAVSSAYEAALRSYASGDRDDAVAEVAAWPERRVRDEVDALERLSREGRGCTACAAEDAWRRTPVRAALMLHSDCAQRLRRGGGLPRPHEWAAEKIARLLKDEPAQRPFARRWFEAMAARAQSENRWGDALDWAERGRDEFPEAAEILLVAASLEETLGALSPPGLPEAREHLSRAHRSLRSAVAADPSLTEARLRLGRVAWRLGETAEARLALEEVLAREPRTDTAFLAHLFLGRLDEDAGRLDDAARAYEEALVLDARSQSARLALSHVRLRLGDPGAARREVDTALRAAGRRPQPDAYRLYPWGQSVGAEGRLEALRREASS